MEDSMLFNEISPSYAMKITSPNGVVSTDIWADNIEDNEPNFPSSPLSCPLGHPLYTTINAQNSTVKGDYYNFNFRMGAPFGGDFYLDSTHPTITHG
ncbi:hypothetical protein CYY_002770 [Polysphondylium violaceum]|uniref:Uncharacterized protein n=1 Tax=Polysphondylium violaceum TaxID=133409 RepID=A0A8J4PZN2_9MYCE|nr:hypothetical protein CYY_002770 [Polysphondylium violaceum]